MREVMPYEGVCLPSKLDSTPTRKKKSNSKPSFINEGLGSRKKQRTLENYNACVDESYRQSESAMTIRDGSIKSENTSKDSGNKNMNSLVSSQKKMFRPNRSASKQSSIGSEEAISQTKSPCSLKDDNLRYPSIAQPNHFITELPERTRLKTQENTRMRQYVTAQERQEQIQANI